MKIVFLSQSLTKADSTFKLLHYNMCITLEELGISSSNAPPHSGKVKILHPLDMDDSQMPIGCWGKGVWKL